VTRVLFIDDEPIVLRSLDRALRARKVPWEVRFVDSGQGALQLLAREPFDIVIADLRIPDLDGVELLTEVQRQYPRIARLVLSGQVGTDDCLRAMRVAHQCLAKPCDIDQLRHVVTNLAWTRNLIDDDDIALSANQLSCLPSPPRVHVEVCQAIGRNAGLAEIAHIIDGDVALTAKLIQVVNSAFFAQGGQVASVQRALSVLGTDVVRGLLLHLEVFRAFEGAETKQVEELSRHSKLVANIARQLAPRELAGDAFVAGMLHDVGRLALISVGRTEAQKLDHARIGGFLLGLWGLGHPIVEAVAQHHDPGVVPDERATLVDILHAAEIVAGELEAKGQPSEVICLEWLGRNAPEVLERARAVGKEIWEQS
jgi:HD-like signal output (HDOD) protein